MRIQTGLILAAAVFGLLGGQGCGGSEEREVPVPGAETRHAEETAEEATTMKTVIFDVHGMHCQGCVNSIKNALSKQAGVVVESVSLDDSTAVVRIDPETTNEAALAAIIGELGYEAKAR